MGLIPSRRHSPEDLRHWATLAGYDRRLSQSPRLARMEEQAMRDIADFAASGPCYVSVSWGKDSVTVAGLVALAGLAIPLVYMRWPPVDDPDCLLVRDAFLARFPDAEYHEVVCETRWYPDRQEWLSLDRRADVFGPLHDAWGDRRITGVRSEESRSRQLREAMWGVATPKTCAPITRWSAVDVFAFLARHDLPIHPAYGCTYAGQLDRRKLRVETLDTLKGKGHGSEEWMRSYYRDEMHAIDARRRQDLVSFADDLLYVRENTTKKK